MDERSQRALFSCDYDRFLVYGRQVENQTTEDEQPLFSRTGEGKIYAKIALRDADRTAAEKKGGRVNNRFRAGLSTILMIAGLSAVPLSASAEIDFGLKTGFDISMHWSTAEKSPDYTVESGSRYGFLIGAAFRIKLSEVFTLQPEILYVQKGSPQNVRVEGFPFGTIVADYDLHYLEVPVVLRTHFLKGKPVQPTLGIGPYFGYLLKGTYTFTNGFLGTSSEDMDDLKKFDFGFVTEYGVEIESGKVRVGVHYRYTMGFVDLGLPTGPGLPTVNLRNANHAVVLEILL